ncbi:MAG TPA: hypothetical protein VIG71_11525 [Enteractinococcus sp.]
MHRVVAQILGVIIGVLAIAGFFVEGTLLLNLMNVDLVLDITRAVLAAALLIVGFTHVSDTVTRSVVGIVGALYIAMGVLAFADATLFGLLPTGLTGFDIGFHLVVGAVAVVLAVLSEHALTRRRPTAAPPHQTA